MTTPLTAQPSGLSVNVVGSVVNVVGGVAIVVASVVLLYLIIMTYTCKHILQ